VQVATRHHKLTNLILFITEHQLSVPIHKFHLGKHRFGNHQIKRSYVACRYTCQRMLFSPDMIWFASCFRVIRPQSLLLLWCDATWRCRPSTKRDGTNRRLCDLLPCPSSRLVHNTWIDPLFVQSRAPSCGARIPVLYCTGRFYVRYLL
jgi:hypothetical protein